jgi:SNF family Na+-dependent transporter
MLFFILSYYNVVLAYSVVYIFSSLLDPFPWAESSSSYWKEDVLNNYGGDYDGKSLGAPQWKLVVALLIVWLVVFFSLSFGKKILAKVTWVTVVGPVVLLLILVFRTAALDGASDGVEFYIGKFDGEVLGDLTVWTTACGQIIFSLSPGMGTAVTLSSSTKPKANVFKTCMIVAFCNSAFSIIGGFAIFSIIGNITYKLNETGGIADPVTGAMRLTTVNEQARAGPGLAFIAIADGMKHFGDGQHVMAILFFMMLLTLGLDSTFAWAETFVTYFEDYARDRGYKVQKWIIVGAVSVVLFLFGIPFCTRMGNELLDTVDHFVAAYYLLLGCGLEALMFSADFTWRRLSVAVRESTKDAPFWRAAFRYTEPLFFFAVTVATPIMSFGLFLYMLVQDLEKPYEGYPDELLAVGWIFLFVCIFATIAGPWKYFASFGMSSGDSTLPALEDLVPAGDPAVLGKPGDANIISV